MEKTIYNLYLILLKSVPFRMAAVVAVLIKSFVFPLGLPGSSLSQLNVCL